MTTRTLTSPPAARLTELDALRGLAAFAVLWFHFTVVSRRFVPDMEAPPFVFRYGHFGVELFFMVSGFVIFMTLNRCRTGSDFLISRFSRLFPTFWASLTITFLVGYYFPLPEQHYHWMQYLINLTMLQEYVFVPSVDPVYWSLSYELGFYAAMFALYRIGWLRHIEPVCILLIAGAVFFYFFPRLVPHPLHYLLVVNGFSHLFVAGIMLYLISHDRATSLRLALLASAPLIQWLQEGPVAGLIVAAFVILFWLAITHRLAVLRWRPLVLLGVISYSLYLIHHMVGFKMIDWLQHHGVSIVPTLLLAMTGSLLLAAFITFVIEKPTQYIIRRRLRTRRAVTRTDD